MADNFDNPYAATLLGLWDFRTGYENNDTGLGDGIAQDGNLAGGNIAGGWLLGDGDTTQFDVDDGNDAVFDLSEGSIETEFKVNAVGETQTVVSRGLSGTDGSDDNFFEIRVSETGAVQVYHVDGSDNALLSTEPGFLEPGELIKVTYTWGPDGVQMRVVNSADGTTVNDGQDGVNLTLDITDPSEQSFSIGARETSEGSYDQNFDGFIDYVAVFDDNVISEGLDGVVEGGEGDDLIDVAYTGDPDGDMIDAGDAIAPGAGADDDLVHAGGGDDTVLAGEGDDTVHGGGGDDSIVGGAGDDVLEGDTNAPGATFTPGREVFEWDRAPDPDDGGEVDAGDDLSGGFSLDTGNVTVDFSVISQDPNIQTNFAEFTQNTINIDSGGGTIDQNSSLNSLSRADGNNITYRLDYSGPVENVSFRINDIDGGGVITVRAYDADGNLVDVNLSGGPRLELSDTDSQDGDDTAASTGGFADTDNPDYSLLVTIPGPIERIEIDHGQDGATSGIQVTDVYYDPILDVPLTDAGDDTLDGGEGDDVILAGDGDDSVIGGEGNDTITGGDGADSVTGDDGDDVIDTSGNEPGALPDRGFPGYTGTTPNIPPIPADSDPLDDRDTVDGGAGNDTITTGDDADLITGGSGEDVIDGGIDDDTIDGGADADVITGGEGSDSILGGEGADTIYGGLDPAFPDGLNITDDGSDGRPVDPDLTNGMDTIDGGAGNDVIFGQDDDDSITGGTGDDTIDAGIDDDTVDGGEGDDSILGGQGADSLLGGAGEDSIDLGDDDQADRAEGGLDSDTFTGVGAGDVIVGGENPDDSDIDVLDLTGAAEAANPGGSLTVDFDPSDPESGTVSFFDAAGTLTGTATFSEVERVIPCFTPGTLIATPEGERRVEDLKVGDRVITRDNGIQEIRWYGQRALSTADLQANEKLHPILIRQGALGNGLPERDMLVSPNHRVLVANDKTALYFEDREVLVPAKHLIGLEGIDQVKAADVTYVHFMFDQHEVILSDGAWTESFQPGDQTLRGLDRAQRDEIFALFPELKTEAGRAEYVAARRSLKKHEAQLLVH